MKMFRTVCSSLRDELNHLGMKRVRSLKSCPTIVHHPVVSGSAALKLENILSFNIMSGLPPLTVLFSDQRSVSNFFFDLFPPKDPQPLKLNI